MLLVIVRGHGNSLHPTLDMRFRKDNCCPWTVNASAKMSILWRAALNMVRVVQRHFGSDLSIGLLRDRFGCQPWILPPSFVREL